MLRSAKLAPTVEYGVLDRFWREADDLGYHAIWTYDHFYGLDDLDRPTLEGWTTLAAMAAVTRRARVGCMVTGVTYRHPALLANMAVTVDHISGGRLEMGMGAAWHVPEHHDYGFPFPSAGRRIAMLDEACEIMRGLWTEERVDHEGPNWTLQGARCIPKPVQARLPIVIGGIGERKTLRVVARHADEWNAPGLGMEPSEFARLSGVLDEHCGAVGREPSEIRRSVQLFIFPSDPEQTDRLPDTLAAFEEAGAEHAVLSFYGPPTADLLRRLAPGEQG
ncbi:MAG TPA: TIGR03560 family F420-dependent LLM class oxidoreductase [Actinomycetota bacterium]|nr:TIGR03560 family F420-dependent LLM class oxidoreductase [Actinomycetota bacterium]